MAQVGSKTLASEINSFYSRLNNARKNFSLATLDRNINVNSPTYSSTMTTLKNDLESTASSTKYLTTQTYDLGSIGIGDPTKLDSYSKIDNIITTFINTCAHDSQHSDDSDDSDHSAVSDYSKHGDDSDKSDNSKNGKCSYCSQGGYSDT